MRERKGLDKATDLNSRICNDLKRHGVIAVGRHSRGREIVLKKESRVRTTKFYSLWPLKADEEVDELTV
jgi:hypothetical protein